MINNKMKEEYYKLRDCIIEKEFAYLDDEQRKAIVSRDRNILVLACPGSGKTTVLINKVLYLVKYGNAYNSKEVPDKLEDNDLQILKAYLENPNSRELQHNRKRIEYLLGFNRINPNNIAVITFTKAAAVNMKNRYEALSKNNNTPFFGTFHGLFYKILTRHYGRLNIIEGSESYKLISNILAKFSEEISEERIKEIRNMISLFKCSDISMEEFDPNVDKKIFLNCYNSYEKYKAQKGLLDFDDLQIKCRELLANNPKMLEHYRKGFKYLLIDEFQDCDNIQLNILKMLNQNNCIFAVGDEDQCIYSFRGSRPDYMVNFHNEFSGGVKLHLITNYRSAENIVKVSENLIKNNNMRNEKKMVAYKNEKKRLEVLKYHDDNSQAEDIALNIEKLKKLGGYKYNENAVLYRTNIESRSLIDAFIRKKIPFKLLDKEYNFFEHFICRDITAYLKLSIFPQDLESFKRIINKPFRYISKISLEKLNSTGVKNDCFETVKNLESTPVFQIKSLERLQKNIHSLNKKSLQGAIAFIISDLGYHDYILEHSQKFKIQISELEDIIEEFKEAAASYNSIITFLAHIDQVGEELEKSSHFNSEDSVIFSTIHGVKGMEFKNVFIVNCVEETIPHISNLEKGLEEERRLFFVALTRTIDNAFICIPRNLKGKLRQPSRFIEECDINIFEDLQEIYKKGQGVVHNSFGNGKIINIDKNVVEIRFENNIDRKFDIAVLHNNGIIKRLS